MSVDGNLFITSYKVNSLRTIVTFYNTNEQPVFFAKLEEPIARIRHILPVKINYIFNGEETRVLGILPL